MIGTNHNYIQRDLPLKIFIQLIIVEIMKRLVIVNDISTCTQPSSVDLPETRTSIHCLNYSLKSSVRIFTLQFFTNIIATINFSHSHNCPNASAGLSSDIVIYL